MNTYITTNQIKQKSILNLKHFIDKNKNPSLDKLEFFLCMTICHSGYVNEDSLTREVNIVASNKEEKCLLEACK